jgi:hypothetical protein
MLLVLGRSRRLAIESHHFELTGMIRESGQSPPNNEFRKTVGDVASALIVGGIGTDMLVLQAGRATFSAGLEA